MLLRYGGARLTEGPDGKAVAEGRALGRVAFDGDKRDAAGKFQEHSPNPTLTVTNGVGYLPDLNAGKSTQARPGFIEHVLERWTRHLYREARGG